jgi:hypothetical protein
MSKPKNELEALRALAKKVAEWADLPEGSGLPSDITRAWEELREVEPPDVAELSFWRHAEGENVIVWRVEREGFKAAGSKWTDLVRYASLSTGGRYSRTRRDFVERFVEIGNPFEVLAEIVAALGVDPDTDLGQLPAIAQELRDEHARLAAKAGEAER